MHHDINDVYHGNHHAHECPKCHHCNWSLGIYTGPEIAEIVNGTIPSNVVTMVEIHPDQAHTS